MAPKQCTVCAKNKYKSFKNVNAVLELDAYVTHPPVEREGFLVE